MRAFKYEEYAKLFSVVFQDYKLFAFPIEENIGFPETLDNDRLVDSIKKSGLQKKINDLPLNGKHHFADRTMMMGWNCPEERHKN